MPKQSSVRWTGKVRLDGRFVKYTNNRINSAERYAWYLNSKHTALGEINSTRICAFPLKLTEHFISKNPPDNRQVVAPKGTTLVWLCGRWPRLVGGLWRGVNYTVNQIMHSECGRICRGAVGEGGLIRGGLLYIRNIFQLQVCFFSSIINIHFLQFFSSEFLFACMDFLCLWIFYVSRHCSFSHLSLLYCIWSLFFIHQHIGLLLPSISRI